MTEELLEGVSQEQDLELQDKNGKKRGPNKERIILAVEKDNPLIKLSSELKQRGLKELDLADLLRDALTQIPDSYWAQVLEQKTPLEYRIHTALNDPNMREKLSLLLTSTPLPH